MRISIAMAAYNGARFINAQLESFASQTRQPDEVIVCDDGSTDNTAEIVRSFAGRVPFDVRFIANPVNLGITRNFSKALEMCTGDLVFLSDQDDIWLPKKIETISSLALADPDTLLFMNNAEIVDGNLNDSGVTKLAQFDSAGIDRESFVMGCCMAVRRELVDIAAPIPNDNISHDDWISLIAQGMQTKKITDEVLQLYRIHGDNDSDFIINRPTKVTKTQVFVWRARRAWARLWKEKQKDRILPTLEALYCMTNGLDETQDPRFHHLQQFAQKKYEPARARSEARANPFLPRIVAVARLIRGGAYGKPAKVRLILKDILG